jgi:hypothetical protein
MRVELLGERAIAPALEKRADQTPQQLAHVSRL